MPCCENYGIAHNSVGAIAPDLIQLILPSAGEGSTRRKRRKVDKREELALVLGFESAVSFHQVAETENDDDRSGTNSLLQTTPSRGSLATNHNMPSNHSQKSGITQARAMNDLKSDNPRDETPAPPTKPKRRAIFRKITDWQKGLDPATAASATIASPGNKSPIPLVPFSKENIYSASSREVAAAEANWSSKGGEKSKWLRIVDIMLKDEDAEEDKHQRTSICSIYDDGIPKDDTFALPGTTIGMMDSGKGARRTRPHHTEKESGDCNASGGNIGEVQRTKRRKVGLVVEQSRTVLESDFWNQSYDDANTRGNNSCSVLDPETVQLIENSLTVLHQQGGGSVMPHLSFLKNDPRLCYNANTLRGKMMINHALSRGIDIALANGAVEHDVGKGRTVLHIAALWGELGGVRASLEMGADPTIFDGLGYSPTGLARKGGYEDVVAALVDGDRKALDDKNIRLDGYAGEEYYYDVYCLEADEESESEIGKKGYREENKSRYLQLKNGTNAVNTDSIPDLEHSTNLSEDDNDTNSSGNLSRWASSIELENGFGYWNEQGELILEVAGDAAKKSGGACLSSDVDNDRIIQRYHNSVNLDGDDSTGGNEDDHDSNDEGYEGNDYPDDVSHSSQIDSDEYDDYRDSDACIENSSYCSDDSGGNWKLDFRNRFIPKNDLSIHDYRCNDDDECGGEELYDSMAASLDRNT